jgi:hypothetical protein
MSSGAVTVGPSDPFSPGRLGPLEDPAARSRTNEIADDAPDNTKVEIT